MLELVEAYVCVPYFEVLWKMGLIIVEESSLPWRCCGRSSIGHVDIIACVCGLMGYQSTHSIICGRIVIASLAKRSWREIVKNVCSMASFLHHIHWRREGPD